MDVVDVAVVGGGQAALAAGYYLRRSSARVRIFDRERGPGGAWQHTWPSLKLFSPARWSSLPGWLMPPTAETYPTRDEALAYLAAYEKRFELPVERPVTIIETWADGDRLRLVTGTGREISAGAVISATGTWGAPHLPSLPGQQTFGGRIVHSAHYDGPVSFAGQRVFVVGAGNSGAQIFADLVDHATVTWLTQAPPVFLPDDVDGQVLFDQATAHYRAIQEGRTPDPPRSLGDIVMVESVRDLRARGLLVATPMFERSRLRACVGPMAASEPPTPWSSRRGSARHSRTSRRWSHPTRAGGSRWRDSAPPRTRGSSPWATATGPASRARRSSASDDPRKRWRQRPADPEASSEKTQRGPHVVHADPALCYSGGGGIRTLVLHKIFHSVYARSHSIDVSARWPSGRRRTDDPILISPSSGGHARQPARICDT